MKKIRLLAKKYTLEDIKDAWETYQKAKGWRVLRAGKRSLYMSKPDTTDGATSVDFVKVRHFVSFPKYLEMLK